MQRRISNGSVESMGYTPPNLKSIKRQRSAVLIGKGSEVGTQLMMSNLRKATGLLFEDEVALNRIMALQQVNEEMLKNQPKDMFGLTEIPSLSRNQYVPLKSETEKRYTEFVSICDEIVDLEEENDWIVSNILSTGMFGQIHQLSHKSDLIKGYIVAKEISWKKLQQFENPAEALKVAQVEALMIREVSNTCY